MSRVGKMPIPVSDKIKISYQDKVLTVKGEKGTLTREIHPAIDLDIKDSVIQVTMLKENRVNRALQGMTRSLQMEAETPGGRASYDVTEVIERSRRFDLDRTLGELNAVTVDRIRQVAAEMLRSETMASAVCGPVDTTDESR